MEKCSKNEYSYTSVNQEENKYLNGKENFVAETTVSEYGFGSRHVQVLLYFLLLFMAFGFRVSLSVGIVAMTDPTSSKNQNVPTYNWKDKNVILSAFFWGYILPQLFAAYVAKKYGAKWFLVGSMILQSILTILIPSNAATFGAQGLMISRILEGVCQGFIYPSCAHFLSLWAPPQERSQFGSIVYSAGKAGTVAGMLVTGLIASSWYGWPLAFYVLGFAGFVWCIVMAMFGYDTPRCHPKINPAEKLYIEKSLGFTNEKHSKTPWLKILTSVPVWALFAAQTGNNYCFWTLLTQIPTYMNSVLDFDMKHNSLWSSMPYLTFWILGFIFGPIADLIINKHIVSRSTARKIMNSIGLFIPAVALILLGYTSYGQTTQAVTLLIVAVGFNAASFSGFAVNHMDLSPNHAGALMGLLNGTSQLAGVAAPLVVQFLVKDQKDLLQWRHVFFLAAGINILSAVIFNIFASGKIQPWNTNTKTRDEEK